MVISANYILSPELGEGGDPEMDKACFLPPGNFLGRKEACVHGEPVTQDYR